MSGWPIVSLGQLAAPIPYACVGGPFGSELTQKDYVDGPGVPVIRGSNLSEGTRFRDEGFVYVSEAKAASLRQNTAGPGDLIFTQRGTIGQVGIVPWDARFPRYVISQSQMKLTPDESRAERRYLVHYLRSRNALAFLSSHTLATGVPHINLSILKRVPVPLPPPSEQRRIADMLDKADAIRRKRKEAIALTDDLLRATFLKMFGDPVTNPKGWEVGKLEDLVELIDYGVTASAVVAAVGPKFLRITDIQENRVEWVSVPYCECDGATAARAMLRPGDIVFARTGATTGKSFLITECPDRTVFASYLIRVRPGPRLLPAFLAEFFQSEAYWSQIRSMAEGAAQPGVNASKLGGLLVPVPPLARQREMARVSETILGMKTRVETAIVDTGELFESLAHRAFNEVFST